MEHILTLEEYSNQKYYHASGIYHGKTFEFTPQGFYEHIGEDNYPIYRYGEHIISEIPETSASKYIGGSLLGSFSTDRDNTKKYIYEIEDKPDKDISHWSGQDFAYLKEVRYRKTFVGKCIGYIILDTKILQIFTDFYDYQAHGCDEYAEFPEEGTEDYERFDKIINMMEYGEFQKILNNLDKKLIKK